MTIKPWPAEDLEAVPICPVCDGAERVLLYGCLTDSVSCAADGEWSIYRCLGCTCGYLDPRPTIASIGRAYAGYYTHSDKDQPIVRRRGRVQTFVHDLINGYQNQRYGLERTPTHQLGRWLLPLVPSLRSAADTECRHLPALPDGGGRLLDVGCGNGGFLVLAKQAGWQVEGLDFDAAAVEAARSRGLDVRCGGVEALDRAQHSYDVITLSHVIEHVHEPLGLLLRLYQLLKPGGMLWLETPNVESLGVERYGRNWRGLEPPRHLVLFSPRSLGRALRKVGFSDLRQRWRGMTVFNIFADSDAIRDGVRRSTTLAAWPPLSDIGAEIREMFSPSIREFLTYTARK